MLRSISSPLVCKLMERRARPRNGHVDPPRFGLLWYLTISYSTNCGWSNPVSVSPMKNNTGGEVNHVVFGFSRNWEIARWFNVFALFMFLMQ